MAVDESTSVEADGEDDGAPSFTSSRSGLAEDGTDMVSSIWNPPICLYVSVGDGGERENGFEDIKFVFPALSLSFSNTRNSVDFALIALWILGALYELDRISNEEDE